MTQSIKAKEYGPKIVAGPTHHRVELVYDPARKIMIALDNGTVLQNNRVPLQANDTVEFWSPQGPVHVGFDPEIRSTQQTFRTRAAAVTVAAQPTNGARIWCGIEVDGKPYGFPNEKLNEYGLQEEFPPG